VREINITEITGFKIGQAQNQATGCTVIISESGAACGYDIRGGSPATRDTDALDPIRNRKVVHAVLLTGGSSFGLAAADGVSRFLEERGIGRDVGTTVVPSVCAAALFDLRPGHPRPDAEMGRTACAAAFRGEEFRCGLFGAGTGCSVGTSLGIDNCMRGGVGAVAFCIGELKVGAIVALNSVGDIVKDGHIIAGARNNDGSFADSERVLLENYRERMDMFSGKPDNTVLGCVITNAILSKPELCKLASIGQNGVARAVRPAHTTYDGDIVFAMCSGVIRVSPEAVGILAARAVEHAIYVAAIAGNIDC